MLFHTVNINKNQLKTKGGFHGQILSGGHNRTRNFSDLKIRCGEKGIAKNPKAHF